MEHLQETKTPMKLYDCTSQMQFLIKDAYKQLNQKYPECVHVNIADDDVMRVDGGQCKV